MLTGRTASRGIRGCPHEPQAVPRRAYSGPERCGLWGCDPRSCPNSSHRPIQWTCAHGGLSSPPPTNEAVVAGGVRTKHIGQITPRCSRAQDPEDAIEDMTVVHPRNAARHVRQHRLDGNPFMIGEFIAMIRASSSRRSGPTATFRAGRRLDAYGVEADITPPTMLKPSKTTRCGSSVDVPQSGCGRQKWGVGWSVQ